MQKQIAILALGFSILFTIFTTACSGTAGSFRTMASITTEAAAVNTTSTEKAPTTREGGEITPTVYYLPHFVSAPTKCNGRSQDLMTKEGSVLTRLCQKEFNDCAMQGICQVKDGEKIINIGFASQSSKTGTRFRTLDLSKCPHGFGIHERLCLDPYHSVAADLSIYKVGEVIYVPAVRGVLLNDGTRHNGYFVVRDTGGAIKGPGRFDFYIGTDDIFDAQNPFNRLKLSDTKTRLAFQLVTTVEAEAVKKARNYPSLPAAR